MLKYKVFNPIKNKGYFKILMLEMWQIIDLIFLLFTQICKPHIGKVHVTISSILPVKSTQSHHILIAGWFWNVKL